ncbi:glycosyltransferase family 39 protein [Caldichromatium japonicum]|uniref:Glycosyltransferase family 39 protein n=1 Tax=Caldichromatium japonicum TaxID=2699430 RepID=A0A6G7VCZ6_9GAMM|nr:glycosyltransferase family 39 protein [Caldichromatium japonicum]QIK37755.1 glycosyltransferase family 39 protein [Caldichromatium japonicum]
MKTVENLLLVETSEFGWRLWISRILTSPAFLILIVALSFFWQLGAVPLYDLDEGAFAEATREMLESGNYITPHRDGEPRYDKPILIYWLQAVSVSLLGLNEFALRLPSALAATLWVLAVWIFVRQRLDAQTATLAGLTLALSIEVSLIGKSAVADALLNLFLALTLFEVYRFWSKPDWKTHRLTVLRAYLWMGLGFLTKGPIAVFFPFLISFAFFVISIRLTKDSLFAIQEWGRAVFDPLGWLIFILIAGPWYLAIYLDDGDGFFKSFFLEHNIGRFISVIHGHRGFPGYYLIALLIILLPFTGWMLSLFKCHRSAWQDPLDRFLWLWFLVVIVFFSFSGTQLPHYLLYGATPLFILMARHRAALTNRWLAFLPPFTLFGILLILPFILDVGMVLAQRPYDSILYAEARDRIDLGYGLVVSGALILTVLLFRWSALFLWQRLILVGIVQTLVIFGIVVPLVLSTLQAPVKEAGLLAKQSRLPAVAYRTSLPSFSVYREAITQNRAPRSGELALVRVDKLEQLMREHPELNLGLVYHHAHVALVWARPAP